MDDCLHSTYGFNIPADYHSFVYFFGGGVCGWIPLETGTLIKNQTPQPVTTCCIVFCIQQTLHFLGRQFFSSSLPTTGLSSPVCVHSSFCLSLQTCNRMSLFCQNEELPQFCCLVPGFEPFGTY
jgi:hypothetical protein